MKKWKLFFLGCFAVLCGFTIVAGNFVNQSRVAGALDVTTDYTYYSYPIMYNDFGSSWIYNYNGSLTYSDTSSNYSASSKYHNHRDTASFAYKFEIVGGVLSFSLYDYYYSLNYSTSPDRVTWTPYGTTDYFNTTSFYYYDGSLQTVSVGIGVSDRLFFLRNDAMVVPFWFEQVTANAYSLFNCNVSVANVSYGAFYLDSNDNITTDAGIRIPSSLNWDGTVYSRTGYNTNTIGLNYYRVELIDSDNNKIAMYTTCAFPLSDYTYYSNNDTSSYQAGYNTGYGDGIVYGKAEGSSTGYTSGYQAGYEVGKIAGASEANDYTFLSLIGAVIDAPINAFTSMFNLDILGVNLTNFFLGLFSIAIILFVVRKIRGGK